ncbi:MAG: hypothetical protein JHD07_01920 [Bradyrhizobium sp.]|uniref:hypothetical protein n=1 Tax=Bradyrhizobium sp. TaxID=376 RepID=UPI001A1EA03C|nr:hypothetical protein [Bradyrhizobium sp.]MBJ7402112.1 hypothetical protein [Bradyrhizobium sp.]
MLEKPNDVSFSGDSSVPAAYTYLGQFIDHDISFESVTEGTPELSSTLSPLSNPLHALENLRDGTLNLDSIYGDDVPRNPLNSDLLALGRVSATGNRPLGRDEFNDLPRRGRSHDPALDRAALIGDPRNDENLIVAQLHVAFLRAHNELVQRGGSFDQSRFALTQIGRAWNLPRQG